MQFMKRLNIKRPILGILKRIIKYKLREDRKHYIHWRYSTNHELIETELNFSSLDRNTTNYLNHGIETNRWDPIIFRARRKGVAPVIVSRLTCFV